MVLPRTSNTKYTNAGLLCTFFSQSKECKYGDLCRYRHERKCEEKAFSESLTSDDNSEDNNKQSNCIDGTSFSNDEQTTLKKSDQKMNVKTRYVRRPNCRYFSKNGTCRDGDKCNFSHQKKNSERPQGNNDLRKTQDLQKSFERGLSVSANANIKQQQPLKRPKNLSERLSLLSEDEGKYLLSVELEQLKKRFKNDDLEIQDTKYGTECNFIMKPTDPDWVSKSC